MPNNNFIRQTLNIKDENITFCEDSSKVMRFEVKNSVKCKIYQATLTYTPKCCEKCGKENINHSIIKNGTKTSDIRINKVAEYRTYLRLKKQRFSCRACNQSFTASTDLVQSNCFISKDVKMAVAIEIQEKLSMKDIARIHEVSPTTAFSVMNKFYVEFEAPNDVLPEAIAFDEFKSVKQVNACMSFIFLDLKTRKPVDIVSNRQMKHLEDYFMKYSKEARFGVKYIVIDMYSPYKSLIEKVFPNAQMITDRFHIIQHISRALNNLRVEVMNSFKTSNSEDMKKYRRLKNTWKMILKCADELKIDDFNWRRTFRKNMSQQEMVDEMLSFSDDLKKHYGIYQEFLWYFQQKDTKEIEKMINKYSKDKGLNHRFQTVFKSFKKFLSGIKNALTVSYSNGPIEGMNNHIKVLKRIAYGYRSFKNFRKRILITQKKLFPIVR
jgi:transposase